MKKLMIILSATLTLSLAATAMAQTADVQIIHNSPDPGAFEVDIYLASDLAIDDFAYRTATGVLSLPAETELQIGVAPGNSGSSDDVLAWFPVTLASGGSYVVMAAGVLDNSLPGNPEGLDTGFNLFIFDGLTTSAPGGEVGLLAFHGAPDAPAVDVRAVGVGALVPDISFGDFAGYITVPAANYTLTVTPAGDPETIVAAFMAPLSGLGGGAAVVFASGFLSDLTTVGTFGLFAALPTGDVLELMPTVVPNESSSWGQVKTMYSDR